MSHTRSHWLLKSEPDVYGWDDLVREREGLWDGVRNHRAAANLRAMQVGDRAFFYHSNIGLEVVGIMEVTATGLTDPADAKWASVKLKPVEKLRRAVTLKEIKAAPALAEMELVRLSRLSVSVVTAEEWARVIEMANSQCREVNARVAKCKIRVTSARLKLTKYKRWQGGK